MKDYLISIIWVSVIVGLAEIISPHISGTQKYIKAIGALCVLCVIAAPLLNISNISEDFSEDLKNNILEDQNTDSYEGYEELLKNYLNEHSANALKGEIQTLLKDNFDIPTEESEIKLFTEIKEEAISLQKVQIILSGRSIFKNPYNIENYIGNLLNCACEVLIE